MVDEVRRGDIHGKMHDGLLYNLLIVGVHICGVGVDICDTLDTWKEVVEEAEGYPECEAFPKLVYRVSGGSGLRRGYGKVGSEVVDEEQLGSQLVALLV